MKNRRDMAEKAIDKVLIENGITEEDTTINDFFKSDIFIAEMLAIYECGALCSFKACKLIFGIKKCIFREIYGDTDIAEKFITLYKSILIELNSIIIDNYNKRINASQELKEMVSKFDTRVLKAFASINLKPTEAPKKRPDTIYFCRRYYNIGPKSFGNILRVLGNSYKEKYWPDCTVSVENLTDDEIFEMFKKWNFEKWRKNT